MKKQISLPQVGKYYWHYDDGKVRPSRQEIVLITNVMSYSDVPKEIKDKIKEETEEHDWLYTDDNPITHVAFGENIAMKGKGWDDGDEKIIYLPSKYGWYGFGENNYWNQGRLDIDGDLTEQCINQQTELYKDCVICPVFPTDVDVARFSKNK